MCVYGVIDDLHHKSVFFKIEIIDMVLDQVQYLAEYLGCGENKSGQ